MGWLLGVLGRRVSSGFALDPAKVKLLLHFDGNYNDSSQNNHTMTSGGNVSISTSEPKFGTGKLQFGYTPRDGFVKSPNIFDFGNKRPFTISFFYRGGDGNGCFFTTRDSATYAPMEFGRGGTLLVGNAALSGWAFVPANTGGISPTAYKHCAVVGDGTDIKVYRDGSLIASTPHPSWASASWLIQLGKNESAVSSDGGMDEFLLYDGVLWNANFTPPTLPFSI